MLKRLITETILLLLLNISQLYSAELVSLKATKISPVAAETLISSNSSEAMASLVKNKYVEISNGQAFKLEFGKKAYYIISATSEVENSLATYACYMFLLDTNGKVMTALNVLGASDIRPWTCDNTEAMSFSDYYKDGSLRIIAIYSATAPSSEQFKVPVIFKLDFRRQLLTIDEYLTKKFDDVNITTISSAKKHLKRAR